MKKLEPCRHCQAPVFWAFTYLGHGVPRITLPFNPSPNTGSGFRFEVRFTRKPGSSGRTLNLARFVHSDDLADFTRLYKEHVCSGIRQARKESKELSQMTASLPTTVVE